MPCEPANLLHVGLGACGRTVGSLLAGFWGRGIRAGGRGNSAVNKGAACWEHPRPVCALLCRSLPWLSPPAPPGTPPSLPGGLQWDHPHPSQASPHFLERCGIPGCFPSSSRAVEPLGSSVLCDPGDCCPAGALDPTSRGDQTSATQGGSRHLTLGLYNSGTLGTL